MQERRRPRTGQVTPRLFSMLILTPLLLILCVGEAPAQSIDPTAATVKLTRPQSISVRELNEEIAAYEQSYKLGGRQFTDREKSQVLWLLIDRVLFAQAAERDHIRITDAQIELAMQQYRQALSAQLGRQATDQDLRTWVSKQGLTWEEWKEKLRLTVIPEIYVAQMKSAQIQNVTPPTNAEIEQYYRSHIKEFLIGDIVEFKHIYVRTAGKSKTEQEEARKKIDEAYMKLRGGESFEKLVVEYSEDEKTRDKGGYAGFLQVDNASLKQMYGSQFIDAVFAVPEGGTSKVIRSTYGYHIVKIIRKIPAKLYSLDEKTPPDYTITPRSAIRKALLQVRQQQALQRQLNETKLELRREAEIRIIERNLDFKLQEVQ